MASVSSTFSAIDARYRSARGVAERSVTSRGPAPHALAGTVIGKRGQATKGARWMSWHREATKDVVACDKLREAGKRASIRRFPNGETQLDDLQLLTAECIGGAGRTRGTETSKYPQE